MLRILLVNTGSNLSVMAIKLAITFIMTPIFIHNMGKYDYGIWEMLGAFVGYMGLLDLGVRPAVSRFAAKYNAVKDRANLKIVYSSSILFLGLVGLVLCAFFVTWGLFFPEYIAEEATDTERYTLLLIIIGAQLLISFPAFVAESYLEAFQKYYLKNNITIFNSIVGSLLIYALITPENALVLLAAINAVGLSIKYLLFIYLLTLKPYGGIRPTLSDFSFTKLKEIIVFGFKSLIQGISSRIENATDSLVIGFFLGPASVPFYAIPANLVNYIRGLGMTLTHVFLPYFSHLSALKENERIVSTFETASKYVFAIMLPLSVGVALVGAPFIGIWVGPEFEEKGEILIYLLVIFTVLPSVSPFSSRYLTAINKHGYFAKQMPIAAAMNILLSIYLVQDYGIVGVAIGSVIPPLIFTPITLWYTCSNLGISVFSYLRKSIFPVILPTAVMAAVVISLRSYWVVDSYTKILLMVLAGVVVYLPFFIWLTMTRDERVFLLSKIRPNS